MQIIRNRLLTALAWLLILSSRAAAQDNRPFSALPVGEKMTCLLKARARWISRDTLVWQPRGLATTKNWRCRLYYHPQGAIQLDDRHLTVSGDGKVFLLPHKGSVADGKDSAAAKKLPYLNYLRGRLCFATDHFVAGIENLISGRLIVAVEGPDGVVIDATGVQLAGLLDDLYCSDRHLGVIFDGGRPVFRLWAPTAQSVKLYIYPQSQSRQALAGSPFTMSKQADGVWEYIGAAAWKHYFYLYQVQVLVPSCGKVMTNMVTDPYSLSLSSNSQRSQIVDLDDKTLQPQGWNQLPTPALANFTDIVIYELHLRDFSASDATLPSRHRGTYLAFTHNDSAGMRHLRALAASGLTHIHLLPTFDIATIEEQRQRQLRPRLPQKFAADSSRPQAAIAKVKDQDAYNWGYDPYHYLVPEGSYATRPDGYPRIVEFRRMIQSLKQAGLRVVLDVVFNHTHSAGQHPRSLLDKIVPGYYYRLDDDGMVQNSSCCPDTASEHGMMEKLIIDAIKLWAIHYHIDGFRFDLMGHHTVANLRHLRQELDALTQDNAGIDGKKIYLYGEGWNFGSLSAIMPESACHQNNSYGLNIGTFNDRIRDALRGGSPFSPLPTQGFATGLSDDYNHHPDNREISADPRQQRLILLNLQDNIRLGLAANLRDYRLVNSNGKTVSGAQIFYRGSRGAGYTAAPHECINYVSVHDNHTLWDCIQAKAPFSTPGRRPPTATISERLQMHKLALSLIALAQGIPLFHAGVEMLRSKSGDSDSYNSGDWFNRLDFSYRSNNWGVGLPIAEKNQGDWDFWRPRLADPELQVRTEDIAASVSYFHKLLRLRKSSPLFRLTSAAAIQRRVRFINGARGRDQIPGLIVMSIDDDIAGQAPLDANYSRIICLFNASRRGIEFIAPEWRKRNLILHPLLPASAAPGIKESKFDAASGTIHISGRTTLVYCQPRN